MAATRPDRPARFTLAAAVHLFLVRDGAVLLLRRANTGYQDGNYSVIAGHLDGDETAHAAIIREAREEAAIAIVAADLAVVGVMHCRVDTPGDNEYLNLFLAAHSWQGEPRNAEPDKCDELAWYPLDRLPPNIIPYVRRALANYRTGRPYDSFGWPDPT